MGVSAVKNKILNQECLGGLKKLPDNSIDCCVTSPPYWGLRDYGVDNQLGLEETPDKYVEKIIDIFNEVRRVLKDEGTLWLNLGDSYANTKVGNTETKINPKVVNNTFKKKTPEGLKPKDLVGIPWMIAFALRSSGWYLRQDIIWHKPNSMPEPVKDRCVKSHEYIFLLSKSKKYYFDFESIQLDALTNENRRGGMERERDKNYNSKRNNNKPSYLVKSGNKKRKDSNERGCPEFSNKNLKGNIPWEGSKANKRSVWTINTKPFKGAHFAAFPEKLIIDCIKAGCPEQGVVLDPFMGAGTTALVARKLNRNYIGFELNKEYIEIANKRLNEELGMFL